MKDLSAGAAEALWNECPDAFAALIVQQLDTMPRTHARNLAEALRVTWGDDEHLSERLARLLARHADGHVAQLGREILYEIEHGDAPHWGQGHGKQ